MEGRRFWNVRTPDRYIEMVEAGLEPESSSETLSEEVRRLEALQLLVRMREGVPLGAFDESSLVELSGLVERRGDRYVLTRAGRLMANEVSLRLVASH
jgi:oxygen-independent coproporphyrinogen-3 oxidase